MSIRLAVLAVILVCLAWSSDFTKITADRTVDIIVKAAPACDRECDLEFAQETGFKNLKTLEGLLVVAPGNKKLLLLSSGSFTRYTFSFIVEVPINRLFLAGMLPGFIIIFILSS